MALIFSGCARDIPESRAVVPRLQLGKVMLNGVVRTYGQPRQRTPGGLYYAGPGKQSLTHGQYGWMSVLTFDPAGYLCTQEFLNFGVERDYLMADYWISGSLAGRERRQDFDQDIIARSIALAESNRDYMVTASEPDLFVLARVLPGGNEPVVQCRVSGGEADGQGGPGGRCEVSATVRPLLGRDEPLVAALRGAVEKRSLLVEIVGDARIPMTRDIPRVTP